MNQRQTFPEKHRTCAAVPVCVQMEQSKLAAGEWARSYCSTELGGSKRQQTNKGAAANVLVPPTSTCTPVAGNHAGRACRRQAPISNRAQLSALDPIPWPGVQSKQISPLLSIACSCLSSLSVSQFR